MRLITEIIVHCSATDASWLASSPLADKVETIDGWHRQNGWSGGIGYHFVIDRDGTVAEGRGLDVNGAHTRGRNEQSIGICLIGGLFSHEDDPFGKSFTSAQDKALRDLIDKLRRDHPAITKVSGHNEYAAKACPGFRVGPWLAAGNPASKGGGIAALIAKVLASLRRR